MTALAAVAAAAASGCAGLPDSADQIVTVDAAPRPPSTHCVVSNALSSWNLLYVPGNVSILRDSSPLIVTCRANGYHGQLFVRPEVNWAVPFTGQASTVVAGTSDAAPPAVPYQGNTADKTSGFARLYPGLLLVPMSPYRD